MAEQIKYIYADAKEKYVKNTVLYGNTSDWCLYYDENFEHAVNGADVLNFFLKGLIISIAGTYNMAVGYRQSYEDEVEVCVLDPTNGESCPLTALIVTEE